MSQPITVESLIPRLRTKGGWWNGDIEARKVLAPLVDENAKLKAEVERLRAETKRQPLSGLQAIGP